MVIGLPDTVWFPADGLCALPDGGSLSCSSPSSGLNFSTPSLTDDEGRVSEIQVKQAGAESNWVWGAFKMPGTVFHVLHALWLERERRDEYIGTLVNAWLARGGEALGVRAGESYVDVGTLNGYRAALLLLSQEHGEPRSVDRAPAFAEAMA